MNELTFHSPLLLLLLPVVLLPAALPYLWKQRMGPATMRYADTGLLPSTSMSLRLRLFPFVPMLRYLALALVIVAVARPQLADAREVIRGEGVDIAIALDVSGSMGEADFRAKQVGRGKRHHLRLHRHEELRPHRPRRIFPRRLSFRVHRRWITECWIDCSETFISRTRWGLKMEPRLGVEWRQRRTC